MFCTSVQNIRFIKNGKDFGFIQLDMKMSLIQNQNLDLIWGLTSLLTKKKMD